MRVRWRLESKTLEQLHHGKWEACGRYSSQELAVAALRRHIADDVVMEPPRRSWGRR